MSATTCSETPPRRINGTAWRNLVIGILTTAVLTMGTAWFTFGNDTVRKDELRELNQTVKDLQRTIVRLETTVAVLAERIGPRP